MICRIITAIVLTFAFLCAPSLTVSAQERGRGARGARGAPSRGTVRGAPAPYYGGGIYGPGRRPHTFDQRWRGVPGGRWYRGRYYAPGVGPCWILLPIVGWSWTCGP